MALSLVDLLVSVNGTPMELDAQLNAVAAHIQEH